MSHSEEPDVLEHRESVAREDVPLTEQHETEADPQHDLFLDPSAGTIPGPRALERQQKDRLEDQGARDRIREDLDASLFVEAAAGAGKTTALVSRIVSLIGQGKGRLDRIVAVTFTDKAAGEMKLRLRTAIEEARRESESEESRANFDRAVSQLEVARIGTIHSFCGEVLRERPVEAGVDPGFGVVAGEEAGRLLDRAFETWFQRILDDPPEGVRRVLRRPWKRGSPGPREQLQEAASRLVDHRDFPAPWHRRAFAYTEAIDRSVEMLRELAEYSPNGDARSWLQKGFLKIARFVDSLDREEEVAGRDHDALEARIRDLRRERKAGWEYKGSGEWYLPGLRLSDVKAKRDELKDELDGILLHAEMDLAACLREELRPVVDAYEGLKRREGALDFLDLLLKARDLVRNWPDVRRELQERFTHFFVDEFQDTDPVQAEVLLLLAADDPEESSFRNVTPRTGKLFLVGDPKQSIYRFRRADVRIYEETKQRLQERGTELVHLTTSFRSVPGIQKAVNGAFGESIRKEEDGSQAEYVPLEEFREGTSGQPAVVALPAPKPYTDYGKIKKWTVSDSYADAVGAYVKWLVDQSGWKITEPGRPDVLVPIRPRHICFLSRRLQSQYAEVMRPYVRALEAREVPHVLIGGRWFHEREEVLAFRNALTAIEWPDDALGVYATLRGPFFALTDAQLLVFKHRQRSLHPLRSVDRDGLIEEEHPVADALEILRELHRGRNRWPIARTATRLLAAVRAHAGIAIWPAGEQALANCLRIVERAREFERNGAPSFRAFVERLEEEAERREGEEAPIVEEGTEGVRIMSVHRAKGLEFPVVILADPTFGATFRMPSRYVDAERGLWAEPLCGAIPADVVDHLEDEERREHAEAVRLAYVAATRARDLLVVPAVGDGEELDGWARFLNPAVYPEPRSRRDSRPAEGCPEFGEDTVLERPANGDCSPADAVRPGLHASQVGTGVVWWDPDCLQLDAPEPIGTSQREILKADDGGVVAERGVREHEEWKDRRAQTVETGAVPELRVIKATTLAAAAASAVEEVSSGESGEEVESDAGLVEPEIEVIELPRAPEDRPSGRRFGELVHRTLAAVELDADAVAVQSVAVAQGRVLGASDEEVEGAASIVSGALAHPLLRRAAEAAKRGDVRRETPVFLELETGELMEGVVDLVFRATDEKPEGVWTIVDFKTDREVERERETYEEQVRLYVRAVSQATGEPSHGTLLVI